MVPINVKMVGLQPKVLFILSAVSDLICSMFILHTSCMYLFYRHFIVYKVGALLERGNINKPLL